MRNKTMDKKKIISAVVISAVLVVLIIACCIYISIPKRQHLPTIIEYQKQFDNFTSWATQWLYNPNTSVNCLGENGSWHVWIRNPLDYGQEGYDCIGYFRQPNSRLEFWGKTINGDVLILTVHDDGNGHFAYVRDYSKTEYPNFEYYFYEPTFDNIHNDNDFSLQYKIKVYAILYYETSTIR